MGNLLSKPSISANHPYKITHDQKKNAKSTPPKKTGSPIQSFPPEVIIEILSRLPFKSLTRFQLVCKEWRALIQDRYFTKEYLDRGSIVTHLYNRNTSSHVQNSTDEHNDLFSYIHGCDGLVLMKNITIRMYCLWNPATRLVLELPDPHKGRFHGMVVSFVPATESYRIVSVFRGRKSGGLGCEIFTPGKSKGWRRLIKFPIITNAKKKKVSVVASGGAVHCVLLAKVDVKADIEIVSLDLETEKFAASRLQKSGPLDGWKNFWDLDWDGKLVVADIVGENIEVMELEDYKKQRWCATKKVIHLPFLKQDGYGMGNVIPLFVLKGEIWFWLKEKRIFTYAIETGKLTVIQESKTFWPSSKIYPYKASLITFEGMVRDTKFERLRSDFGWS